MEQQSKYYTPDISELHVGYECEIGTSWGFCKGKFPEVLTYDTLTGFAIQKATGLMDVFKAGSLRTKYLDQSDIESLGWEFDKSRGIPLEYHYTKEVNLKKYKLTKLSTKIHIGILQQGNTLYEGECKSINELRKIMEWLNIK